MKKKAHPEALRAMEARSVEAIPVGDVWQYEPKWDGFRCLLSRHHRSVELTSKSGQSLTRYFPEVAEAALQLPEDRFVLDGELVVPIRKRLSFDDLLQRLHPAATRVKRLAAETPALMLIFDLLLRDRTDLSRLNLAERRPALERFAKEAFAKSLFKLSPASRQLKDAKRWLTRAGGGCDGVIAKRLDMPYQSGNRDGMQKIKRYRTADCVVGGFRYAERQVEGRRVVGSLLLGLYDDEGLLHHVGFTSGLKAAEKLALTDRLEAISAKRSFTGSAPGGPSRWTTERSAEWQAVKPKFVVEVTYDHFTDGRFRHGTAIARWRPDKRPRQCTMDQLQQKVATLDQLLKR